jgi:LDH2 family malate/lactate/ureidoglycolate dehydrogenase
VDALVRDIRTSRTLPGVEHIRIPGDGSVAARMERLEHGIPLPPALLTSLDQLAAELKIPAVA